MDTPEALENVPYMHVLHMEPSDAPSSVKYFPASHSAHTEAPAPSEYEPGAQLPHVPALAAPRAPEKVPAVHAWQADSSGAPSASEYLP